METPGANEMPATIEAPKEIQVQPDPVTPDVAAQKQEAMGTADRANQRAMRHLRAELKDRTMKDQTGRIRGPLQPCTIMNFNPVPLHVGGQINMRIPSYSDPSSKTQWEFRRGGRLHRAHYVTLSDAKYYLSPGGSTDHPELTWAAASMVARYIPPMEIAWHFWRTYSTAQGDGEMTGGVLIFDGDIHELDEHRLKQNKNKIWVPEAYTIPETDGQLGVRLRESELYAELEKLIEMQVRFTNDISQKAYSLFNSKDDRERRNVTRPMRIWGIFGVEIGYFKEKQPWMNENADARGTFEAMKTCPVCRTSTTDPEALMCGACKVPYDAKCTVECVRRGWPVAESVLDVLPDAEHKEVLKLLSQQAERRAAREKAARETK